MPEYKDPAEEYFSRAKQGKNKPPEDSEESTSRQGTGKLGTPVETSSQSDEPSTKTSGSREQNAESNGSDGVETSEDSAADDNHSPRNTLPPAVAPTTSRPSDARQTRPLPPDQDEKMNFLLGETTKIRIIGLGECGSKIAGTFMLEKPYYVPSRREEMYPIKSVAFDTDNGIREVLTKNLQWQRQETIMILPMPNAHDLTERIMQGRDYSDLERSRAGLFNREQGGVGGQPFLGRLAAESTLLGEGSFFQIKQDIQNVLIAEDFTKGILMTCNSLTGGTGTGFSPIATRFLRDTVGFAADLTLNLSILPSEAETDEQSYPRSIFATLHTLLTSEIEMGGIVDSVIIADNDALARIHPPNQRVTMRIFNQMLRDMLVPILLAPIGRYNAPDFTSSLDAADFRRWIRGRAGFDHPEISVLGSDTMPVKSFLSGRFASSKSRSRKITQALERLADGAKSRFLIGKEQEDPKPQVGGIAVLFGPPSFFRQLDIRDVDHLTEYLRDILGIRRFRTPACLEFTAEGFNDVGLSLLVSGISSSRLEQLCEDALGPYQKLSIWDPRATLAENICKVDEDVVEEMMIGEIREALHVEPR